MNKLKQLFEQKSKRLLSIYITAGFPQKNSLIEILASIDQSEVDFVEVGMPYSDPLADGPVIQHSSAVALANDMSIETLFEQLNAIKDSFSKPIVLMGYLNPVLQYGIEKFYTQAKACGVAGIIIPDLPKEEYIAQHQQLLKDLDIYFHFLITPSSPVSRIKELDELSNGFIYLVSSNATTGGSLQLNTDSIKQITELGLKNKIMMGFGISNKDTFEQACSLVDGAIIGSAFIKHLTSSDHLKQDIINFTQNILKQNNHDYSISQ